MGSGLVHGVLQGELENAGTALLHVQKDIGLGAAPELASLIEWLNWPKYFLYSVPTLLSETFVSDQQLFRVTKKYLQLPG